MSSIGSNCTCVANAAEPAKRMDGNVTPPASEITALVARCQAGCRASFDELVGCYAQRVFNFLHQFVRNREDAEDLTQETFVKAFHSIGRYCANYSFTTWLFTIAKRTAISHFRMAKKTEPLADYEGTDANDPSILTEQRDERLAIWQLARKLPVKQFEALWLRYAEGLSIAETARVMSTNQIHVKVLLHRARKQLAVYLTPK